MTSTAVPAKFRFDLDLGHRQERNSVLTESALATLIANARAEGRQQGIEEGTRSAMAQAAGRLAQAAEKLADHAAALNAAMDDHRHRTLTDAVSLASTIARKLAGHLVALYPAGEIEALISECLASLDGVPHLVIRCAPELADQVRDIAQTRITTSGFSGRLIVMGDPDRPIGDARLEWVDGGLERNQATLAEEIDRRIGAYLAARNGAGTTGGQ